MTGTPNEAISLRNLSSNNNPVGFIGELIKIAAVRVVINFLISSILYCRPFSSRSGTNTGFACAANTKLR